MSTVRRLRVYQRARSKISIVRTYCRQDGGSTTETRRCHTAIKTIFVLDWSVYAFSIRTQKKPKISQTCVHVVNQTAAAAQEHDDALRSLRLLARLRRRRGWVNQTANVSVHIVIQIAHTHSRGNKISATRSQSRGTWQDLQSPG